MTTEKKILGIAAAAFAVGVVAGTRWGQTASVATVVETGLAGFMGCSLLVCLWLWFSAKPGSGDAMVLPTFALLQAAMLANILPRLLWPDNERIRMAGLIVGLAVPAVVLIAHIRRRRQRKSP